MKRKNTDTITQAKSAGNSGQWLSKYNADIDSLKSLDLVRFSGFDDHEFATILALADLFQCGDHIGGGFNSNWLGTFLYGTLLSVVIHGVQYVATNPKVVTDEFNEAIEGVRDILAAYEEMVRNFPGLDAAKLPERIASAETGQTP